MKKLLVLVLLVPILALTMISCDADMRSNIANLMGGFGGNVYEDAGLIVANTAQAEAAAAIVATIGTVPEDVSTAATTESFGVVINVPDGVTTILAPQTPAEQTELKDNLGDAFNSDTQKEQLLEELKTEVKAGSTQQIAAQGTVLVFNATLKKITEDLGVSSELGQTLEKLKLPEIADTDNLTQGDLLALQLMTDLISNTVATLSEIGGGALDGATDTALALDANKDKVLSIIDDALFAAEVAEQISGAASIDFTGQIDLGSLLDGLGDKSTRSRDEPLELTEAEDFIGTINALAPTIVDLMGITYNGTDFDYDGPKYKSFLLNQQIYRSSMEQALKMMALGNVAKDEIDSLNFNTSTLVKYALAVFITEHDGFWKSEKEIDPTATPPNDIIALYLNDSAGNRKLGLGTLTKDDVLTQPTGITGFDYANWPAFLKTNSLDYYKTIISNIILINDAGGIAQLSTELETFRDAEEPDDGLTKWYNELL